MASLPLGRQDTSGAVPYPQDREQAAEQPHPVLSPICDSRLPLPGKVVLFRESRVLGARLKAFIGLMRGEKWGQ